jgi:hypothetical protein
MYFHYSIMNRLLRMNLALRFLLFLPFCVSFQSRLFPLSDSVSLSNRPPPSSRKFCTSLCSASKKRSWARDELLGKDVFDDNDQTKDKGVEKFKLEPETTYFEGPPSPTEIIFPAISILTVIGIIPFIAAVSRQFWVRYKFTSRRVSIQSGIGGNTQTQIIYPDILEIKFAFRAFGAAGDMVMFLKDGAKVELRHVPDFESIYNYVLSKCDAECQAKSMKITKTEA